MNIGPRQEIKNMVLEKREEVGPTTRELRLPGGRRLFFSQTQVLGVSAQIPGCCIAIERPQLNSHEETEEDHQKGRILTTFQEVKEPNNNDNASLARQ